MRLFTPKWYVWQDAPIEAHSKWSLPVTTCPACKRGGGIFWLHYPSASLLKAKGLQLLCRGDVFNDVEWDEFERIRTEVRQHLDSRFSDLGLPLHPGTCLGPSVGKLVGKPTDIMTSSSFEMLITQDADRKLRDRGIVLSTSRAEIRARKGGSADVLDVEALPLASLAEECNASPCKRCGFSGTITNFAVDRNTIPKGVHVFRAKEDPSKLLLSEQFVEVITELKLTGLPTMPVEVSD